MERTYGLVKLETGYWYSPYGGWKAEPTERHFSTGPWEGLKQKAEQLGAAIVERVTLEGGEVADAVIWEAE